MKLLISFLLPLLFWGNTNTDRTIPKDTYYYYCTSRSMPPLKDAGKQVVLYTEVKEITCEESFLKTKAADWGNYVGKNCRNQPGCTSDLNSYKTLDDANSHLAASKKRYSDAAKFIAIKVDF